MRDHETKASLGRGVLGIMFIIAVILVGLVVLTVRDARDAAAHEAQLSDGTIVDYSGLRSANGMYDCCGNRDCEAVEWREVAGGKLEAMLPGFGWVMLPVTHMRQPHPDAPSLMHVCWERGTAVLNIRCVLPPGFGM